MPDREVNFGPMPIGTSRRIEKFIIENHGEHDFKYVISKYLREISPQKPNPKYVLFMLNFFSFHIPIPSKRCKEKFPT